MRHDQTFASFAKHWKAQNRRLMRLGAKVRWCLGKLFDWRGDGGISLHRSRMANRDLYLRPDRKEVSLEMTDCIICMGSCDC